MEFHLRRKRLAFHHLAFADDLTDKLIGGDIGADGGPAPDLHTVGNLSTFAYGGDAQALSLRNDLPDAAVVADGYPLIDDGSFHPRPGLNIRVGENDRLTHNRVRSHVHTRRQDAAFHPRPR